MKRRGFIKGLLLAGVAASIHIDLLFSNTLTVVDVFKSASKIVTQVMPDEWPLDTLLRHIRSNGGDAMKGEFKPVTFKMRSEYEKAI
jgi:hypothetical protein